MQQPVRIVSTLNHLRGTVEFFFLFFTTAIIDAVEKRHLVPHRQQRGQTWMV